MPKKHDNADLRHEALWWKVRSLLMYFPKPHRAGKAPYTRLLLHSTAMAHGGELFISTFTPASFLESIQQHSEKTCAKLLITYQIPSKWRAFKH